MRRDVRWVVLKNTEVRVGTDVVYEEEVVGTVDAPNIHTAEAQARAFWGRNIRVMSEISYNIQKEEDEIAEKGRKTRD